MRKTKKVLLFAVILVVLGSFLASMFHTSFFQVKVKEIEFETERGHFERITLYAQRGREKKNQDRLLLPPMDI